jgi:hypothetical protein
MKRFVKPLAIAGVAGAMALGAMTSSEARPRGWAAAGVGFAAGALVGAAAASAANSHYHGGYYYDGGYAYAPAPGGVYYSAPAYDGYAYEPAPTYRYHNRSRDFRERQFNASNS